MSNRTATIRIFFVLIAFGFVSLLSMLTRPGIANIRSVDVVHLIGTGMCFGGAIVALAIHLRDRQS